MTSNEIVPASIAQLDLLKQLKVEHDPNIEKRPASDLITATLEAKKNGVAKPAAKGNGLDNPVNGHQSGMCFKLAVKALQGTPAENDLGAIVLKTKFYYKAYQQSITEISR